MTMREIKIDPLIVTFFKPRIDEWSVVPTLPYWVSGSRRRAPRSGLTATKPGGAPAGKIPGTPTAK